MIKRGTLGSTFFLLALLAFSADSIGAGSPRNKVKPEDFGNVEINNFSEANHISPVIFPHWVHRARYTCRLCHVDIGFAMRAGETGIRESDVRSGLYCGVCHDGKTAFASQPSGLLVRTEENCHRCHSSGKTVHFQNDFFEFQRKMPRDRFGNRIDWIKAEEEGRVKLKDFLEGTSLRTPKIERREAIELTAKIPEMPKIVFSHEKHAVWNGCQLCHPDLFGVRKGSQPYSMQEIFAGKYCGACHDLVAFPNLDCQKCHTEPVF